MSTVTNITRIGMDLGKNVFHLCGVDEAGLPLLKKKLSRKQVLAFLANLQPCLVGLEACGPILRGWFGYFNHANGMTFRDVD